MGVRASVPLAQAIVTQRGGAPRGQYPAGLRSRRHGRIVPTPAWRLKSRQQGAKSASRDLQGSLRCRRQGLALGRRPSHPSPAERGRDRGRGLQPPRKCPPSAPIPAQAIVTRRAETRSSIAGLRSRSGGSIAATRIERGGRAADMRPMRPSDLSVAIQHGGRAADMRPSPSPQPPPSSSSTSLTTSSCDGASPTADRTRARTAPPSAPRRATTIGMRLSASVGLPCHE
jgi:hypothetical protein